MRPFLLSLVSLLLPLTAHAQGYVLQANGYYSNGKALYERVQVQVPYQYSWWSYGKYYVDTRYRTEYQYKEVLNYAKPDWRNQALALIDKQKERESFESTLQLMGVQGLMAPKNSAYPTFNPQQQFEQVPYNYPSAAGSTVGAFSYYEKSRYGYPPAVPLDVNKGFERVQMSTDAVVRMTADIGAMAGSAVQQAVGVQRLNAEQVGAIAEMQELKGLIKERALADRDKVLAEKEKLLAEAEVLRSMKSQPAESFRQYQGNLSQPQQQPPPAQYQQETVPPPPLPPQGNQGHPGYALAMKYCGDCHAGGNSNPAGGFVLDKGIRLSQTQFASLRIRMDPKSPDYRKDESGQVLKDAKGRPIPFRMPPPEYPAPNGEETDLIVEFFSSLVAAPQEQQAD